jgi:hypothetical protein
MAYNWISVLGHFVQEEEVIVFKGGMTTGEDGTSYPKVGNYICDQNFYGGTISGEIEFTSSVENEGCEFILYYEPSTRRFTSAGLGGGVLCNVRSWDGNKWIVHAIVGDKAELIPGQPYRLQVTVQGSLVKVTVNSVNVLVVNLPFFIPQGQPGIWCVGEDDIRIKNYQISSVQAKAFVVMQFTPPYDELYRDVIVPVCKDLGLTPIRADEMSGPGLIITDIAREIMEARVIIADITPANPNVYYEVGYAHAIGKPAILIAEKPTSQLPFDVSGFRVLRYENTIGGKAKVEAGLRKHLEAIKWSTT